MATWKVVGGALLAASLVGNVLQWRQGGIDEAEAMASAPTERSRPPAAPSPSTPTRPAALDDDVDVARPCPAELARIANRLTEVEAELDERRRPPERFDLSLHLDIDGHGIQVHAGGTLATEPAGRCLRAALDTAIAATEVPERVAGAVRFYAIELPRPGP